MLTPLIVLLSVPLFSTEIAGEGSIYAVQTLEKPGGYFTVLASRDNWGGEPRTTLFYLNEEGVSTLAYSLEGYQEPLAAVMFAEKKTILCHDRLEDLVRITQVGGAENTDSAEFPGQFTGGCAMEVSGDLLYIAGNDEPGDSAVRIAVIDQNCSVVSNSLFTEAVLDVSDITVSNGYPVVMGSTDQPGWQRDIAVFDGASGMVHHLQPGSGRYQPVTIDRTETGYLLVANGATVENGRIGEIFIQKLSSDFQAAGSASLGGASWITGSASVLTEEGIAVTGWTNSLNMSESNRSDLILAEFSEDLSLLWTREYGGTKVEYGLGIHLCSDRGFTISGCLTGGLYSGWVLRTDSTGSIEPQGIDPGEPGHYLSVSSNPSAEGMISVILPEGLQGALEVSVVDMTGRIVQRTGTSEREVHFTGLPSGVYLITAEHQGETLSVRAVVTGGGR